MFDKTFYGNYCFENIFTKAESHKINTRNAIEGSLSIPKYNSTTYGLKSIYKQCIDNWNQMIKVQKCNSNNNYPEIN